MEGVEPTHSYEYQILSLARLPIPPHRLPSNLSPLRYTKVPNMRKHLFSGRWQWAVGGAISRTRESASLPHEGVDGATCGA